MSTILRTIALATMTLFVGLAVLAPPATAQGTTFTVGTIADPAPLQPDIGSTTITVPWKYSTTNPAQVAFGASSSSVQLTWDPPSCDNPNVLITGSLSETIQVLDGTTQNPSTDGESIFNVAVGSNAPGETKIRCSITGSVSALQSAGATAPDPATGQVNVQAQYLGLLSVNVPGTIKQAGPQKQIRYDLEISNLGNSRSNVLFGLVGGEEGTGEWNPVLPTQITLESSAQGGTLTSQTVAFVISTPFKNGWNNNDRSFQVTVTPASTKDAEATGQVITVNVLARVRGVYVPSLEPMVLVAAVLGTALVARLARQD